MTLATILISVKNCLILTYVIEEVLKMVIRENCNVSGRRVGILVAFAALLFVNSIFAQTDTTARELPFKKGEKLTYVLSYTWGGINTDVGEGVVTLNYENGVYNPVVKGYTYKFYDMFFTVREHFESHFDEKTLRPYKFYRNTLEGKYRMINNYTFNNDTYEIHAVTKKKDYPEKDSILPGRYNTYDLVTLYFVSRTLDFNNVPVDEKQPISFAIDREIFDLYFVYKGKEVKKVPGMGTYNTMKFAVRLVAGEVFTGKDELFVWVTDDKNKIPLMFESKILVGKVYGRLTKWENLKYPLDSKVKK